MNFHAQISYGLTEKPNFTTTIWQLGITGYVSILLERSDPFIKAKPDRAHSPAPYIHSASCRCPQTTHMPHSQSAYKSHLPLLNTLERVPVTDWSADFSQAWALGKGDHPHTIHVEHAYGLQSNAAQGPHSSPGPQTHICALWMHDDSSLRPGLMAEPWYTPTGPRTLLTGTGEEEAEQWRGSGHQANLCKYDQSTIKCVLKLGHVPTSFCIELNLCTDLHFARSGISQELLDPRRSSLLSRVLLWTACAPTP